MTDPKHRSALRAAREALAAARVLISRADPSPRAQALVVLALREASAAVQATGLDARMAGELALAAEHRASVLRRGLTSKAEAKRYAALLSSPAKAKAAAEQHKALPFFTRFLEEHAGSASGAVTQKYPSDADDYVTLKYPSDRDDTREAVAAPMIATLKYPSDNDEVAVTGSVPGRHDADDDPTEVVDRAGIPDLRSPPTRQGPFDEDDSPLGTAELDEALRNLEQKLPGT